MSEDGTISLLTCHTSPFYVYSENNDSVRTCLTARPHFPASQPSGGLEFDAYELTIDSRTPKDALLHCHYLKRYLILRHMLLLAVTLFKMALRIRDLAILYIFFVKAAAQPKELFSELEKNVIFSDFHTLCQNMEEGLLRLLKIGLLVTVDYEMEFSRIQISSEHSQGWPLSIYYPRTSQQFEAIIDAVQNDISYDENVFSGWWQHKFRFICLPRDALEFYNYTTSSRSMVANVEHSVRETVYAFQMDHIAVLQFLFDGLTMTWRTARECSAGAQVVEEGATGVELLACLGAAIIHANDLKNLKLKALVQMPQDDHHGQSSAESTEFDSKEMANLLGDFQELLQFKSKLILGKGFPRYLVKNGTRLNGLGEQIMDKEADICIAALSLSPLRGRMLHFLQPIRFEESAIIYLGKTAMLPSRPLLLHPFSLDLWITFGMFFVGAIVTSLCVGVTIQGLSLDYIPSRFEPLIFTIAASFNQGGSSGTQHVSIRIVVLTASLTSSVLYMAYSGAFVASVSTPASPVYTYNSLKKHGFSVFTDPTMSYGPDFVESVKDQHDLIDNSQRIYQGKMDMVNKVLDPDMKYAAIYRKDMFYSAAFNHNISIRQICQTSVITSGKQSRVREALVMRKGSPLREPFSQKNNLLIERGLTKLYRSRYDRRIQPPCKIDWKYFKIIGFQDCLCALGILAAGSILSMFFFLTEFLNSLLCCQSTVKKDEALNCKAMEYGREFVLDGLIRSYIHEVHISNSVATKPSFEFNAILGMLQLRSLLMALLFYSLFPFNIHEVESIPVSFLSHFCKLPLGKIEGILHNDQWNFSNLISFETRNSSNAVHVSIANNLQSGSFTVYSPKTQAHFIKILKSISENVAYDENDLPKAAAREAHILCLPNSSGSSPFFATENDFLTSQQLHGVHLPFNGEFYVVKPESSVKTRTDLRIHSEIELIEMYSLANRLIFRTVSIPGFNAASLIDTAEWLQASGGRQDLKRIPVNMVAQKEAGYEASFDISIINGETVFNGGTQYQMSLDYQRMLNFTYVPVFGTGWPRQLTRNGTRLNGMGEQLMDKEADMITMSITFTTMRAEKFHFLPAVGYAESGLFYRGGSVHLSTRGLLLRPFTEELWGTTVATFVVILLTTLLVTHISIHLAASYRRTCGEQPSFIWTTGILLCQGGCFNPPELPRRVVILTAALTSALLYSAYTGAFVASVSVPPANLQSLDALKKQGFTIFGDPDLTAYTEDFIQDPNELEQLVMNSKSLNIGDMESIVRKVLDQKQRLAGIYRADGFYGTALSMNITTQEFCEISVILAHRECRALESFAVRKGWPFRELFTQKTALLVERGLSEHYWSTYIRETKPPCIRTWKYRNMISVEECAGAFGVLVAGVCMAMLALISEFLYNRKLSLDLWRK